MYNQENNQLDDKSCSELLKAEWDSLEVLNLCNNVSIQPSMQSVKKAAGI